MKALARPLSQKRDLGRVEAVALEDAVCKVRAQFLDAIAVAWTEGAFLFFCFSNHKIQNLLRHGSKQRVICIRRTA